MLSAKQREASVVRTPATSTLSFTPIGIPSSGSRAVCGTAGVAPAELATVLHGTTVATNAVLEGRGARVGLLVTEGWAHLLHLAESWTPGPLFGFFGYVKPEPLVAFEDIREVRE